ncbi:MBL fold metallo-hydrolase [Mucilaginibacter sp. RS28]|uniref:MBL fold metallo-hydrolase n=2 Tax=Mucilaginibacter straminoryzae TaxID=2932774 RepID=A0A9X1X0W9_9SPHI|nr:MBL fold metallo-hydrolase [Mucilaginibacter straminoryzae]
MHSEYANQNIYIESLGGAGTVTGSKHLLRTPEGNILIDCGLFQGLKALREKNWEPLPFNPAEINAVILTHAHLDHCGYLPILFKDGYRGPVYMTETTKDLTILILKDSARIQEEDAFHANKHHYSKHKPAKPLYTTEDVEACIPYFKTVGTGVSHRLSANISFRYFPAGHIPGASSAEVTCFGKTIFFSGDIGRYHAGLLADPQHVSTADFVVMEATYGDRTHPAGDASEALAYMINDTVFKKGNILIPCFAVGRAQEVIHMLYKLKQQKAIPAELPIYLDSPMAAAAGKVVLNHSEELKITKEECRAMFNGIQINEDYRGTEKIIDTKGSKIILAGSGMLTGGRALAYLEHYIGNSRNTILLIGFQAEGTRGRSLLNGAKELKFHGKFYSVEARVEEIRGMSAHADQKELRYWINGFVPRPERVYLVHGEPCSLETLRVKIKDETGTPVKILQEDHKEFLFAISEEPAAAVVHEQHHNK